MFTYKSTYVSIKCYELWVMALYFFLSNWWKTHLCLSCQHTLILKENTKRVQTGQTPINVCAILFIIDETLFELSTDGLHHTGSSTLGPVHPAAPPTPTEGWLGLFTAPVNKQEMPTVTNHHSFLISVDNPDIPAISFQLSRLMVPSTEVEKQWVGLQCLRMSASLDTCTHNMTMGE